MRNLWVIYELIPAPFKRKKRKLKQELEKPMLLIYIALNFRGALKYFNKLNKYNVLYIFIMPNNYTN